METAPGAGVDVRFPEEVPAPPVFRGFRMALNFYFVLNFIAVAVIGYFAFRQRIRYYWIVPLAVAAYAPVLLPYRKPRLIIGLAVLGFFPALVILNGYGYPVAQQCWLPVLLNLFFVYLEKPDFKTFAYLVSYHLGGLVVIFAAYPHPDPLMDVLGVVTDIFGAALLVLSVKLIIRNADLLDWNRALAERHREFAECLKRISSEVIHDLSRWTALSHLGITLSGAAKDGFHKFVLQGIDGANALAARIKGVLQLDRFAYLEMHTLDSLLDEVEPVIGSLLTVDIRCPGDLRQDGVLVDKGIFANAVLNLAENAKKAGARLFRLDVGDTPQGISIEATDDGRGFPEEGLGDLFRGPVKSLNGGTGVGLLNLKMSLSFMGADIRVLDPNVGGSARTRIRISGLRRSASGKRR